MIKSPNPEKVKAIVDAPLPTDLTQLQSYLGTLNFYRKFLPDIATILEPINMLLKKEIK